MMEGKFPDSFNDEWVQLSSLAMYSACDVSDVLLKLKDPDDGEVPRAGYLVDLVPYAPNSPFAFSKLMEQPKVIGPASTVKLVSKISCSVSTAEPVAGAIPQGQHWADLTDEGHVVVIEQPQDQTCAAVGGLMALRMHMRGVKACVVGGRVRDLAEMEVTKLPVWAQARSTVPMGAEAKALARGVDVSVGGVTISQGDIIFCDPLEGVVAIPRELLKDVVDMLPRFVAIEERVRYDILGGSTAACAIEKHRK